MSRLRTRFTATAGQTTVSIPIHISAVGDQVFAYFETRVALPVYLRHTFQHPFEPGNRAEVMSLVLDSMCDAWDEHVQMFNLFRAEALHLGTSYRSHTDLPRDANLGHAPIF